MTWPTAPLGEVAETALGKMLDMGKPKGHAHVPYLRNVNVQWGRIDTHDLLTMELAPEERDRFAVQDGDLLVCEGGEIGRSAIWRGGTEYLAYQKALHRIRPTDVLDSHFLRYLLEHYAQTGTLAKLATGSTIAHLPQQQLRRVPVPLPTLAEQRRIVDLLEDLLSRLDAADGQAQVALRRTDALRRAVLRRTLTADESWKRASIGDWLATSIGGLWGGAPGSDEVDVQVVRVTELKAWGRLDPTSAATRSISQRQLSGRKLQDGDLLLEKSGGGPKTPVGRVGLVVDPRDQSICANFMQLMRPNRELVHPEFLHLLLNAFHLAGNTAAMQTASTNIRNIKASEYLATEIAVPDHETQLRLVNEVREEVEAADRLGRATHVARARAATLRRSLLAAAFSGRLTGDWPGHDDDQEAVG